MKRISKIIILMSIAIIIGIFGVRYFVSFSSKIVTNNIDYLSSNDPDVIVISKIIKKNNFLKKNPGDKDNFTKDDILDFVLDMMSEEDYRIQSFSKKKLTCQVTSKLFFTIAGDCNVLIISLDTLNKLQSKYLNTNVDLSNLEINYKGLYCKYEDSNYYCLKDEYKDDSYYMVWDLAYREEDIIYMQFYILASREESCLEYDDTGNCLQVESISEEDIKNDGALIKYEFKKSNEGYVYLRSYLT